MTSLLKSSLTLGILAIALTLTGCATAAPDVTGTWGEPDVAGKPSLELTSSGEVSGTDGCNRLMGSYTVEGNTVTFGELASTMMFCEGVDTWLVGAATATVSGDEMTVFNSDGKNIGSLEKA